MARYGLKMRTIRSFILLVSLVAIASSGCGLLPKRKKPKNDEPSAPKVVGTVTFVSDDPAFVLVDVGSGATPEVGMRLNGTRSGQKVATLEASFERRRPFMVATIIDGEP